MGRALATSAANQIGCTAKACYPSHSADSEPVYITKSILKELKLLSMVVIIL